VAGVLFKADVIEGIRRGDVTVAYRRWARPSVVVGTELRTQAGVLAVDAVDVVDESSLTDADAAAAGAPDVEALLHGLRSGPDRQLFRVRFHRVGDDPRIALRALDLTDDDAAALLARLDGWDRRSPTGPWTRAYLAVIERRPETLAATLADELGLERLTFKRKVRQLKELGLTESLPVGYRLSARGEQLLARLRTT
jgi:DNA-binding MarR family transcriptional regulator